MCAGVNSVNGSAVNGEARSQNRYLTVAVRRSCRCSAGIDCLLRAGPYATWRLNPNTLTRSQAFVHAHTSNQTHIPSALAPIACKASLPVFPFGYLGI